MRWEAWVSLVRKCDMKRDGMEQEACTGYQDACELEREQRL